MARFVFRDHHTYQRVHERDVTWEMVDYVLEHPDAVRPGRPIPGRPPTLVYIASLDNNRLRVYVERDSNDPLVVVTVGWEVR